MLVLCHLELWLNCFISAVNCFCPERTIVVMQMTFLGGLLPKYSNCAMCSGFVLYLICYDVMLLLQHIYVCCNSLSIGPYFPDESIKRVVNHHIEASLLNTLFYRICYHTTHSNKRVVDHHTEASLVNTLFYHICYHTTHSKK